MEAEPSRVVVRHAVELGINFFDTADMYSAGESEVLTGQFVREFCRREETVIATKAYYPVALDFKGGNSAAAKPDRRPNADGLSRKRLFHAVDDSLRRLGTDYIDLYQLHGFDALTPIEETLRTLDDLVRAGKIRYIGCSNFSGWHLMKSLALSEKYGLERYVAHQAYYSLIGRDYEWELMPLALDQRVGTVVWSPLGWGRLTGKIRRGQPLPRESRLRTQVVIDWGPPVDDERVYRVVDALDLVAAETGKTVPQVAINWLLQRPSVANVIIGARNEEQLTQNLGAVGWNLTKAQVAALDAASTTTLPYPYWHQTGFTERNPPPV